MDIRVVKTLKMVKGMMKASLNNKVFLILVSFVVGTIVSLFVLQESGESRCYPYHLKVTPSNIKLDDVVSSGASEKEDESLGDIYNLEESMQMRCMHLLTLGESLEDSGGVKAIKGKSVAPRVDGRIVVSSDVGDPAGSDLEEGEELPVPECNYDYVSVAGVRQLVLKLNGGHTLAPVSETQDALEQIQECAKKTGASDFLDKENRPQAVFIMTVWRSGSSFFGEALSSHPAFYYYYEPLMFLGKKQLVLGESRQRSLAFQKQIDLIKDLKNCNYSGEGDFAHHIRHTWNILSLNNKIKRQCSGIPQKSCTSPEFVNGACQLFPIPLFKLTRLRGFSGETLLEEFPGSKLIYLFRDPRGIFASRNKVTWCDGSTTCGNISALCCSLNLDIQAVRYLQGKYPDDVQVVKYEHIALNPVENFKKIFKNLNIPWHPNIQKYLWLHTKEDANHTMSTVKVSAAHTEKWKRSLSLDVVEDLQEECELYMKELDYSFVKVSAP